MDSKWSTCVLLHNLSHRRRGPTPPTEYESAALESKQEQISYLASLGMKVEAGRAGLGCIDSDALDSRLDSGGLLSCVVLPSMVRRLLNLSVGYVGQGPPSTTHARTRTHTQTHARARAANAYANTHTLKRNFQYINTSTCIGFCNR